jgi:hypothetical protein
MRRKVAGEGRMGELRTKVDYITVFLSLSLSLSLSGVTAFIVEGERLILS